MSELLNDLNDYEAIVESRKRSMDLATTDYLCAINDFCAAFRKTRELHGISLKEAASSLGITRGELDGIEIGRDECTKEMREKMIGLFIKTV